MKNNPRTYQRSAAIAVAVIALILPFATSHAGDKMKPEEIVAKHLESIGPAETRAAIKSRVVGGTVVANLALRTPGTAQYKGQIVLASEGNKNVVGMGFENVNYTREQFGFDGETATVGYSSPGGRSNLGGFLFAYKSILKYGLVGGVLSDSWPLLNLSAKQAKLEYVGMKKIGEKQTYELKYIPRGGIDLEINLFFDSETFQHVRTEYTRFISAGIGSNVDASGSQRASRSKMVEDFADFRKEGGLTVPHNYKIALEIDNSVGTFTGKWDITLNQFAVNQPIQPAMFNATARQ